MLFSLEASLSGSKGVIRETESSLFFVAKRALSWYLRIWGLERRLPQGQWTLPRLGFSKETQGDGVKGLRCRLVHSTREEARPSRRDSFKT